MVVRAAGSEQTTRSAGAAIANARTGLAAEARLREQLRATLLQLRTAETEKANLQASQAAMEAQNKSLTSELETKKKEFDTLTAESEAAQVKARQEIGGLTGRLAESEADLAKHRAALEKWRLAHRQVTGVAQKKEEQRAAAALKIIELERQGAEDRRRNVELFTVGEEILNRYSKFGFGEALSAREPFTGLTRTKLETLVQGYQDRLLDNVIKP